MLSVAAGRHLLVVLSLISKSVCPCPETSGWLLFSQWQSQLGLFSHTVLPRRLVGVGLLDDLLFCDGRLWDGRGLLRHGGNGSRQQLVLL